MASQPQITTITFENTHSLLAIGHAKPRLSWRFAAGYPSVRDWKQRAYELEIRRGAGERTAESYSVESGDSVLVPWPSAALESRDVVQVRVRAFGGESGDATEWSVWVTGEAGLLDQSDWSAKLITNPEVDEGPLRPVLFRRAFSLGSKQGEVAKARLYTTACGVYEAHINGKRIGNEAMAPGWTSYKHRLHYQVFDVTESLKVDSDNVIGVEVGEGWYAGRLGFHGGQRFIYGRELASLVQLEVEFADSSERFTLISDESWICGKSPRLRSEIYDGEVYDMREEQEGWNESITTPDGASWVSVKVLPPLSTKLIAPDAPPVTVTEEVSPVEIIKTKSGKTVLDFGQNLVGKVRVNSVRLPAGQKITFTHVEVLENGEISTRPLRGAVCVDTVIFSDKELRDWTPKFTFHGFQYVQVDGWPATADAELPSKSDFTALVMHTNMERTGWFNCSEPLVNKLHENVVWGMRGNFLSIPTDCPQRDERLGWTGDIQVFCPSANFLYNTAGMLSNWLEDVSEEQSKDEENMIPGIVVPNILRDIWPKGGQAVWHDVVVLTPWDLYNSFGDVEILRRQYESMKGWVEKGIARGPDGLWDPLARQLGDWLDPAAPPDEPSMGRTDGVLVADAYLVRVTSTLAQISAILNHGDEVERYSNDAVKLKAVFQSKYITPLGLLVSDTQTALSIALAFNLHEQRSQAAAAAERLSRLVRTSRFRISTGFAGTPLVTHALTRSGQSQLAYRMLLEKKCPSWLYPVTMGATTAWERWDSMLPDGSINPGSMTSFNHYALGSVINWLHTTVGGISPLAPGWKEIMVRPVPGGTLTSAEVRYESPYGKIECSWTLNGTNFAMKLEVPPNSTAVVILPDQVHGAEVDNQGQVVGSGVHEFSCTFEMGPWPEEIFDPFRAD
ncbi:hypothetical protein V492_00089 [Pseudogymnoascus sp. VKM F-4246]|nr:hypothetical protein V492_00089 [Pseudogymnoascus sp. VKM F-4246]